MKYLELKNQDLMPIIGLGTWKSSRRETAETIINAIRIGYRHFDCAPRYENEKEVGEALEYAISYGLVRREDLWITTKLWNNAHQKDAILPALQESLKKLKLTYLDLFLIHWPVVFKKHIDFPKNGKDMLPLEQVPIEETWTMLEHYKNEGLIRHIGVSNFSINKLKALVKHASIKPEMNQVELHPFLQQSELYKYCKNNNIHLTAYSPLGSKDRLEWLKQANEPSLFKQPILKELAIKKSCSIAQIILAWSIARGIAVIPKSIHLGRLKENLDAVNIQLTKNEMTTISKLDKHYRYITGNIWTIPGSPYTLENLWDE